jgi:hypothetical protein
MKARTPFRRGLLAATALAMMATTHAALVTWGAPQNITCDSDVSTAGTLVGALNIGATGVGSTTVNGVTFTGVAVTGSNNVTSGIFGHFPQTEKVFCRRSFCRRSDPPTTATTNSSQQL